MNFYKRIFKREINFYFQTVTFGGIVRGACHHVLSRVFKRCRNQGRAKLSGDLEKELKCGESFFYGSARSALYALLKSLEFPDGSEVLVTGYTCDVVPNAVINAGLKPVYVDISLDNYCMDPRSVEERITDRTRVIIVQHTYGIVPNLEKIIQIANRHSLFVIEDCAVSLGSCYKGRMTGTFGDAAIFSFELSKTITSCWGGALVLNSNNFQCQEKQAKFYEDNVPEPGLKDSFQTTLQLILSGGLYHPGFFYIGKYIVAALFRIGLFKYSSVSLEHQGLIPENYLKRLSHLQAFMVSEQLKLLGEIKRASQKGVSFYMEQLGALSSVVLPEIDCGKNGLNLIRFPLRVEERVGLGQKFINEKIELGYWFRAPLSSQSIDHSVFSYLPGSCPNAEFACKHVINLPVHIRMTDNDLANVVNIIENHN